MLCILTEQPQPHAIEVALQKLSKKKKGCRNEYIQIVLIHDFHAKLLVIMLKTGSYFLGASLGPPQLFYIQKKKK
jgi:hypothetical protein